MFRAQGIIRLLLVGLIGAILIDPQSVLVVQKRQAVPEDAPCLVTKVNEERAAAGLAALIVQPDLTAIGERQAQRMADSGNLSHNPDARAELPPGAGRYGENVAMAKNCEEAHAGLMASPQHRENILGGQYTHIGIGEAEGSDALVYISQVFLSYEPESEYTPPPFQWRLGEPQPASPIAPIVPIAPLNPMPTQPLSIAPTPPEVVELLPPASAPVQIESKTRALSDLLEREESADS